MDDVRELLRFPSPTMDAQLLNANLADRVFRQIHRFPPDPVARLRMYESKFQGLGQKQATEALLKGMHLEYGEALFVRLGASATHAVMQKSLKANNVPIAEFNSDDLTVQGEAFMETLAQITGGAKNIRVDLLARLSAFEAIDQIFVRYVLGHSLLPENQQAGVSDVPFLVGSIAMYDAFVQSALIRDLSISSVRSDNYHGDPHFAFLAPNLWHAD